MNSERYTVKSYKERKRSLDFLYDNEGDPQIINTPNSYTWTSEGKYAFKLVAFTIQNYLRRVSTDWFPLQIKSQRQFHFEPDRSMPIVTEGTVAFAWEDRVHCYECDVDNMNQTIRSQKSVEALVKAVQEEVKLHNPLRRKHIQIQNSDGGLKAQILSPPKTTFEDLILDPRIKEDLYDNTIFQLKNVPTNNGVILCGFPGTGKSLACQAIIHEVIKEGFSTCFLVGNTDFDALDRFLQDFLTPCVLVLEDIDTFAEDRLTGRDRFFADFLQFMSGLTTRADRIVVIATTNHLDLLDEAVKNRPLRFNRKYKFHHPCPEEIERMLGLHFDISIVGPELRRLCYDREFTGAHIAEIKRTAISLCKKRNKSLAEGFEDAVAIVTEQFSPTLEDVGFNARCRQ